MQTGFFGRVQSPKLRIFSRLRHGCGAAADKKKGEPELPFVVGSDRAYFVAFSSFFMIEKMKRAEIRQSTIRIDHSCHSGRLPHSMPMIETR